MAHPTPPAPWKFLFNKHVSQMKAPQFVLSTVSAAPPGSPTPYVPRARYCLFRGFWTELPPNGHSKAARNPAVYASDLPMFTTDVRMEKIGQIFGAGKGKEQSWGSGGGGPVEAVWWCEESGTQWRIKGRAFVVAPDVESGAESSGVRALKSEVGKRMRIVDGEKEKEWSWARELTAIFDAQSPAIQGSFKAPPPGQPVHKPYDSKNLAMGATVSDPEDPIARQNFRVVIIVPDSVEQTDLNDPATARRYLYTFDESTRRNGGWKAVELWP